VEFPENVRLLALAGADFVAVPTASMQPYLFVARSLVQARAYENQVFLAYVNRCGQEQDLSYYGLSCITGPDGADLARAGTGEELILADLDPGRLAASRETYTYLRDRRPQLYGALTVPDPSTPSGETQ
jgi:predicted amidohydrolase